MVEGKFRGKRKDNGEWVYGFLFQKYYWGGHCKKISKAFIIPEYCIVPNINKEIIEVIPETVGWYIGIKDNKYNDMYIGDKFKWFGHEVRNGKQIRPERVRIVEDDFRKLSEIENIISCSGGVEVIGDIHDDPDLIKKEWVEGKTMKILGQYDSQDDDYDEWKEPVEVVEFGDTLRDKYGMVRGVKDEYGNWVSPTLWKYGISEILKVIQERK